MRNWFQSSLQMKNIKGAVKHGFRVFTAVFSLLCLLVCTIPHRVEAAAFQSGDLSTVEFVEWKPVYKSWDNLPTDDKEYYMLLVSKNLDSDPDNAYFMGGDCGSYHAKGYSIKNTEFIQRFFKLDHTSTFITASSHNLLKIQYAGWEGGNGFHSYYISAYCNGKYRRIYDRDDYSDSLGFTDGTGSKWGFAPWQNPARGYTASCDVIGTVAIYYNDKGGKDSGFKYNYSDHYFWADEDKDYDDFSPFFMWIGKPFTYSALTKDYTVCRSTYGDVLNFDGEVIIKEGVTLTIEPGAVLSIEGNIFNNGTIENYGTIIVQSGATVTPFDVEGTQGGSIYLYGNWEKNYGCKNGDWAPTEGNMIVMAGGKVATDVDCGTFQIHGGNLMNWGFCSFPMGTVLNDGTITNNGYMMFGIQVNALNALYNTKIESVQDTAGRVVKMSDGAYIKWGLYSGFPTFTNGKATSITNNFVLQVSPNHNLSEWKKIVKGTSPVADD